MDPSGSLPAGNLQELKDQLQALGQDLMVLEGSPELVLPNIVDRFSIDHVTTNFTPGWYESQAITFLEQKLPATLSVFRGNRLFDAEQFPFAVEDLPDTFSPFRRRVEKLNINSPIPAPGALPPPPSALTRSPSSGLTPPGLPLPAARSRIKAPVVPLSNPWDCRLLQRGMTSVVSVAPVRSPGWPMVLSTLVAAIFVTSVKKCERLHPADLSCCGGSFSTGAP